MKKILLSFLIVLLTCTVVSAGPRIYGSGVGGGVGSMTYPGVGVPISTGLVWGISLNITGISDSTSTTSSTTVASSTAVKTAKDAADAKQVNLGLIAGTMTNGYLCTYTSAGTLISCNTDPASITGSCVATEIDAHAAVSPTAAQLSSCNTTIIHNYNQAAADVNVTLPATATKLGFLAQVSTAQTSNYWRFTSATAGDMYLNGSATGKNYVQFNTAALVAGAYFGCFSANIGNVYKWFCTSGVGTLTTN